MEKNNSNENNTEITEVVLENEISRSLSLVFAKSVQELLPGYLPNKLPDEYTDRELKLYQKAYAIVSELVQLGKVEVSFRDITKETIDSISENERIRRPVFKLISGGKKERGMDGVFDGKLVVG